jgi:hypothetical protein
LKSVPQYVKALLGFEPGSGSAFVIFDCLDNADKIIFNRWTHTTDVKTATAAIPSGETESTLI